MAKLDGASILITGGTGSFGQRFIATILERYKPRKIIVFSRDEAKQWDMSHDPVFADHSALRFFIGDVRDRERLLLAFRDVDFVVHAAALKHIPIAEYNPFECIQTNVVGAENVVAAAMHAGVQQVIALSTDKAANPINLYGASKLAADKIFVAARHLVGRGGPTFAVVRYGNVVASRGSVVALFAKLIAQRVKELPITDARMTRFWITLQQGADFVLSNLDIMQGGEIFVPRIPSMSVVDLAKAMAPNLPHRMVGIRPGEKLHEMMITEDDARSTVELGDRYVILPSFAQDRTFGGKERRVPEDFQYASNTNDQWMTPADLLRMLRASGMDLPVMRDAAQ